MSVGLFVQGRADFPGALWKVTTVLNSAAKLRPKQSGCTDRRRTNGNWTEMGGGHRGASGKAIGGGRGDLVGFTESTRTVLLQFQGS